MSSDSIVVCEMLSVESDLFSEMTVTNGLPDNHTVRNIQFYGDSGNSSLSPNLDIDAMADEGRQSLGLIV